MLAHRPAQPIDRSFETAKIGGQQLLGLLFGDGLPAMDIGTGMTDADRQNASGTEVGFEAFALVLRDKRPTSGRRFQSLIGLFMTLQSMLSVCHGQPDPRLRGAACPT
ncbi:hypothetical protein VH570_00145 [Sphingobium sp. HT1-2]